MHSQINPPEENRQLPGEAVKESITITSSFLAGKVQNRSLPRIMTPVLGPGDSVVVELMDIPEYSGIFTIGPDGSIYLPRIHSLFVEGLTIKG